MSARPEVLEAARQWVTKAEEDLTNAVHTLSLQEDCPFATVCFHAQQTAEKHLKALLTLHSVPFPKTHDLTELLRRVPPGNDLGLAGAEVAERPSAPGSSGMRPGSGCATSPSAAPRCVRRA